LGHTGRFTKLEGTLTEEIEGKFNMDFLVFLFLIFKNYEQEVW
jgi:hypothetical protein